MLEEKLYQRGKIKLNYAEGPDNGPAFLLLPAYDNRWQSYSSIIPQIAANTHLYALDTRGRGGSDRTPGEYELRHSLNDTIGFIEGVIGGACNVFGHSNGGWIGLWLGSVRPDLVSSLIVGDSALDVDALIESGKSEEGKAGNQKFMDWAGKPVEELVQVFSEKYPDNPVEYIEMKALTFNQVDPEIYRDWVEGRLDRFFEGYNGAEVLRSIKCPTLILHAENGMISLDDLIWARGVNEELKVKEMNGRDHWIGIQDGKESGVISEIINLLFSL